MEHLGVVRGVTAGVKNHKPGPLGRETRAGSVEMLLRGTPNALVNRHPAFNHALLCFPCREGNLLRVPHGRGEQRKICRASRGVSRRSRSRPLVPVTYEPSQQAV